MAYALVMPKFGMTMKEARVVEWLKEEGDFVEKDETVLIAENEKFTNEVKSLAAGVLLKKVAEVGESYPVGGVLGYLGEAGESAECTQPAGAAVAGPAGESAFAPREAVKRERIIASPLAKKLAAQLGIELSMVTGTGPNGRIEKADIEKFAAAAHTAEKVDESGYPPAPAAAGDDYKVIPYTGLRRAVGENMARAWASVPMVTHHVTADAGALTELRKMLNEGAEGERRVSFNTLLLKLTAEALRQMPAVNATFEEGEIRVHSHVNLGMATALEGGLIVPVIRQAESKSLMQIHDEAAELAKRARGGRLSPDDTHGGTFTVTNLGGYGSVDFFTPIVNPPQAAILGVGRIRNAAVPAGGTVGIRPMLGLSLTYDHRVVDGAVAAEFMQILIRLVENPIRVMLR
jgi:pyruvate dehydrogenase E2 component (dihydrolipoamide acetyltransferase)